MERWLSGGRAVFCTLVLTRLCLLTEGHGSAAITRLGFEGVTLGATIAVSVLLAFGRAGRARAAPASTMLDAVACFSALATNVIWPWPGYHSLFLLPDPAALLLVVVLSGLRYSVALVAMASFLAGISLTTLAWLDHVRNSVPVVTGNVTLLAIYLAVAATLGTLVAHRSRALALASARASLRAERARRSLDLILQEQHDAGSSITAAVFGARTLRQGAVDAAVVDRLHGALVDVSRTMRRTRDIAHGDLAALEVPAPAAVAAVAHAVIRVVQRRFPEVAMTVDAAASHKVRVAGGEVGLTRVLLNLLVNAAEGDGSRGATRIAITCERRDAVVHIAVTDDGPGLATAPGDGRSTKVHGSGLGSGFVRRVVEDSGGQVSWRPAPGGGTTVHVLLAAAV